MLFADTSTKWLSPITTYQAPVLMVYVGALAFACIYYRRAPTACLLGIYRTNPAARRYKGGTNGTFRVN